MTRRLLRRTLVTASQSSLHPSPILSQLYAGRGIVSAEELNHKLDQLLPPDSMKGIDRAADLLAQKVVNQERILVVGDFDADGATSSALMVSCLKEMGAASVDYLVPNRFDYGYGLTPEIVTVALTMQPALIITVDNGISSIDGVALARKEGVDVLVTDHHLPGEKLPDANVIVNPNQPGCEFGSKALAGVGVSFYVLSALRQVLRLRGWFSQREEPRLADYLDLVALGTVADVVALDRNNRILVQEGIRRIRAGRSRPGVSALLQYAGTTLDRITSRDLAFSAGPRLNAAGRLEDMSIGIECLMADSVRAMELAAKLDEINSERKSIEEEMKQQAEAAVRTEFDPAQVGICLFNNNWHEGVVGIIASRIKDRLHRPVIAFARAADGTLKGSARSIQGLHIRDALAAVDAQYPAMIGKFGGHAMAAGLSLHYDELARFTEAFDREAKRWLSEEHLENTLVSDGELNEPLTLDLARLVVNGAPWGQGFAEPLFDGEFEVIAQRIVAERHLKLKLRHRGSPQILEGIAFNHPFLLERRQIRLAYRIDINYYRERETVQLIVEETDLSEPGRE